MKSEDGSVVVNDSEKANLFNVCFQSAFIHDNGVVPDFVVNEEFFAPMGNISFGTMDVRAALLKLHTGGAAGPDGIPAIVYVRLADMLATPLSHIFDKSFSEGKLPSMWKKSLVIPIFKKGAPTNPANYRPISLTCIPCKIMESLIVNHMMKYFVASPSQFGFMKNRCATVQLIRCLDLWSESVNNGSMVDIIFLDYAKAFDCVCHSKLLFKLQRYGCGDSFVSWFTDFLCGRSQSVRVGSQVSNPLPVHSGVPQGSVLGPIMFVIYIDDMLRQSKDVETAAYADDTYMSNDTNTTEQRELLQQSLNWVANWSNDWQLRLSSDKCYAMYLGHLNPMHSYFLGTNEVKTASCQKHLGILFCDNLKFGRHCIDIANRAHLRANLILKCFKVSPARVLVRAFNAFVRPILEYGSEVWNPYLKKDILRIEAVQRRFSKRLPGMSGLDYGQRLEALGMESLELRRVKIDLRCCYKLIWGLTHSGPIPSFLKLREGRALRGHPLQIVWDTPKLNCRCNSFVPRVGRVWNALPWEIALAESLAIFNGKLRTFPLPEYIDLVEYA
jgi:hypothetical protein